MQLSNETSRGRVCAMGGGNIHFSQRLCYKNRKQQTQIEIRRKKLDKTITIARKVSVLTKTTSSSIPINQNSRVNW